MGWRIAESLETLRRQLNAAFPNRSKASDGGIGDAKHASRSSDHNPWIRDSRGVGVVTARDFTHDPANGLDCNKLAEWLVESRDPRIKYIIWNKRICSSKQQPWKWRPYSGVNAHRHHLHLSVDADPKLYDSTKPWDLDIAQTSPFADLREDEINLEIPKVSAAVPAANTPASRPEIQPAAVHAVLVNENPASAPQTEPPPTANPPATEQTNIDSPQGKTEIVEQKNEQDVSQPAEVAAPEPQGVFAKLTGGVSALFSGTIIYTVVERFSGFTFSQTALILICLVVLLAFLGFLFWAALDAWKTNQRVRLEVEAKTDKNRKDLVWVKE